MTIKDHRELACWQLSAQLRDDLIAILDAIPFPKDLDLCRDLARSARSAPANIAEGFGQSHRTFHRHLDIAKGSLRETGEHLDEAAGRHYLTTEQHAHFKTLATRAHKAADRLAQYLESIAPPPRRRDANPTPRHPTKPNQPNQPAKPNQPNQPAEPNQPYQPAEPNEPN
jgi:four helix bundle protein